MTYSIQHFSASYRLCELSEQLSGCVDVDFDTAFDDLDREFQELRFHLESNA